jgi:glycosyltransferase involved in cell wall biosynthesis
MRVLHLIAGSPIGGAETYAQDAILALAERGVTQKVVCRPHPIPMARYAEAGVPAAPFGFSLTDRLLGGSRVLAAQARDFKADLVHAWMGRAASFVAADLPMPALGWFGGYYDLKYYRNVDGFVGVTHDIVRHIEASGAPRERSFVVHTFGDLPDSPPVDRATFQTPEGRPVVLVLSRMHVKKGIDTIIRAMAKLPDAYLWLAGDGPEKKTYETLAADLGLADRIRFLGWRTDRKALLEACDVCALPSRYEPFGTVIAEAWATGKPLVASRAAGASQYVRDGETGLLCDIDDVDGLADRIAAVLADPGLAARITAGGAREYERAFSRQASTDAMLKVYERMIALGKREKGERDGGERVR